MKKIKVLLLPCANGYEYKMHNYDFNPLLEKAFKRFAAIEIIPFPYHHLQGVNYQGVFSKKYCLPIIDHVHADIIVMSRFNQDYNELASTPKQWGYTLRLLNTQTLEQKNSINAAQLPSYDSLESDLEKKILLLGRDITLLAKAKVE